MALAVGVVFQSLHQIGKSSRTLVLGLLLVSGLIEISEPCSLNAR